MYNPVSTYRLQFNKSFTLVDANEQLEYLKLLGVGTIYASPVFHATPGSMHGYDVTYPYGINPEVSAGHKLRNVVSDFKAAGIGWLQDVVPNHMAFNQYNKWLWDVLEKGVASPFARYFDIDWSHPGFSGKVMVPFLGEPLDEVIRKDELKLQWHRQYLYFIYYDNCFPISPKSFLNLVMERFDNSPASLEKLMRSYVPEAFEVDMDVSEKSWEKFKTAVGLMAARDGNITAFFNNVTDEVNAVPDRLFKILDEQHYQLCHWKETEQRINYRRFFTVNDLICLRMERKEVFRNYHEFIGDWLKTGTFDGLRIDHVDGLQNPHDYFCRLRELAGADKYIVVEKILEHGEELPGDWPVQGTTGYDFLTLVNDLLTNRRNMAALHQFYDKHSGNSASVDENILAAKRFILCNRMAGEWDNLTTAFFNCGLPEAQLQNLDRELVKESLGEFLLAAPLYRLYTNTLPVSGGERKVVKQMLTRAEASTPRGKEVLKVLGLMFLSGFPDDSERNKKASHFFQRCMQFTGPLMAKGVEDTLMYRHTAFLAHNEVGGAVNSVGITAGRFHKEMERRCRQWPMAMNCTATHDTKRGEDVRSRLIVISNLADEWMKKVQEWMGMNGAFKSNIKGLSAPSFSEEYLIYQTLVGFLPFNQKADESLISRLDEYLIKALREAKHNTNWSTPNEEWEIAVIDFAHAILEPTHGFLSSFLPFQERVATAGIVNSLSQLTLKMTCPGVPDVYQGTEMWDFSLVDPDNRRPVDFTMRHIILRSMIDRQVREPQAFLEWINSDKENGNIKLWLTARLLQCRRQHPQLFAHGDYIPLSVEGRYKEHLLAFARRYQKQWFVSVVPLTSGLFMNDGQPVMPSEVDWGNTRVLLPDNAPEQWHNLFSGATMVSGSYLSMSELFLDSPVGILYAEKRDTSRLAGVLMHITSLPGKFGSGDFGPQAYRFIDFLNASGHRCWQVLPFTQTMQGAGWSPYSPPSAFAGNILFISPSLLAECGLIESSELEQLKGKYTNEADFGGALQIRYEITRRAWFRFRQKGLSKPMEHFRAFCERENYWLHDYSLFLLFKELFNNLPWNQWPDSVKNRDADTLAAYARDYEERLDLDKFRQYLFTQQWHALKQYANYRDVKIIGDVPIYVSYDNADVWCMPHLFKLDSNKSPLAVAGVPPDYFSETGQLWNMPVFDWQAMKDDAFRWWINRISKNLQLFDLVRLDHFRGFDAYWEVPAGESTAVNGSWIKAEGRALFNCLKDLYPKMPFIAEDLGEITADVYALRDDFKLPGMQVLQFSFGDDMPESIHTPHNYPFKSVVYTGTHDNNTIRGWYKNELSDKGKARLGLYTGIKPRGRDSHKALIRLAWASNSDLAIVPMQDLLGLGSKAQMNKPSVPYGNWVWRLKSIPDDPKWIRDLREQLWLFGRID